MFKSYEEFQNAGKDGWDAYVASATVLTKGVQTTAQDAAEYSKKSFEKSSAALEKLFAAKSPEKAFETQQAFAKEVYEDFVSHFNKLNEKWMATAQEAYKPHEATFAAFGLKAAK